MPGGPDGVIAAWPRVLRLACQREKKNILLLFLEVAKTVRERQGRVSSKIDINAQKFISKNDGGAGLVPGEGGDG